MSGLHHRRNRSVRSLTKNVMSELLKSSSAVCAEESSNNRECNKSKFATTSQPSHELVQYGSNQSVSATDSESSITIRLSGLSSTSSLSWSDEYESGVTKKVQDQLEKLDRIFLGVEDVPNAYDKEEIEEWLLLFPNLCILGSKTPLNSPHHSESDSDSATDHCDTKYSEDSTSKSNYPYSPIFVKHLISRDTPVTEKKLINSKNIFVKNEDAFYAKGRGLIKHKPYFAPPKMQNLEIDKYLKISPIKSSKQNERKRIPTSQLNKQVVSCEADIGGSTEYISLPYITTTHSSKSYNRKSGNFPNTKKTKEKLVLPPITNHFRSISATPRRSISSSFSVFGTNLMQHKRNQLMSFVENVPLTNR